MTVEIRQVSVGGKLDDFLNVVDDIYRDDPSYVRPLDMDVKGRLSKSNPFFEHGEAMAFTAYRGDTCVGRCTASIDRAHLERYNDEMGFFGFIDTIDDIEVAQALLDSASHWLKQRGMKRVRGPLSLNINEEWGLLIDGFDTPPMIMMPHHRDYQGKLVEESGFSKLKDLYAWRYEVGEVPKRAMRAYNQVIEMPEVSVRQVDKKHVERDVRLIMDVFNDAWSDNFGFVPLTESELAKTAADMKLILEPELTCIVSIDGKPMAVGLALPNVNEMIGDLNGKLLPTGAGKLLWRLKVKGPKTARLIILGIRRELRNVRKYAGLSAYMYTLMNRAGQRLGIRWGELSWTLEDNGPVNVGIKMMGGKIYKTYRVYEREI